MAYEYSQLVNVDGGGRIILPKAMRDALAICANEKVAVHLDMENQVIVVTKTSQDICPTCGNHLKH